MGFCLWAKALYAQKPRHRLGLVGIHCFILRAGSTALCRDDEDPKGIIHNSQFTIH